MPDDPRVQALLDEMLDRQVMPEEVCRSCPELRPKVLSRWRKMCRASATLDVLLPPGLGFEAIPPHLSENGGLPRIPGYEVDAVLGQGGAGVVFRARNLRLGRPVALKMLLAGAYAGPAELLRFQREVEAVASLCHPNIVQIYEVGEHECRPYFTMELVVGGSLAQKLASAPPQVRWAAELVASVADAVAVAHGAGIVHRDLTPANILLTADSTPKVSDFGLARRLEGEDRLTWTGTAVGTPSYMAPEQASGTIGPAADVYGLGAVLYEALTGRPPFRGGTTLETFRQVLTDEPVPPSRWNPQVPRDLETVCLKCLQKDPRRRYPSATALAEDLRRYLLGQVVSARPVGNWERAGKWIRRNPAVAGLSTAAVLALVSGTVASLLFALQAGRQADIAKERAGDLERQTIELKAQTLAAELNAHRAREKEEEATRIFLSGLLIPLGRDQFILIGPGDSAEWAVARHLRAAPVTIRMQFLEMVLSDPDIAQRVGRRTCWLTHPIVGCDRAVRADAEKRIVRRIQEPNTPQEVRLACARLGVSLNIRDRVWAERSAAAVVAAMRDPTTPHGEYPHLAETLTAISELLPKAQAADHAAQVVDGFVTLLQNPDKLRLVYHQLGQAVVVISPWLDAEAAARMSPALSSGIRLFASNTHVWEPLTKALATAGSRLPPPDAAPHLNRTADLILDICSTTPVKNDPYDSRASVRALLPLCGGLDEARSARVADMILAILGDSKTVGLIKSGGLSHKDYADVLTAVADRLDEPRCLRVAEEIIRVLRKADSRSMAPEEWQIALVSASRRLDAAGMSRVAEAVLAAVRDPETSAEGRTAFAGWLVAVDDRLDSTQADSLERAVTNALLADLADVRTPRLPSGIRVCQSLTALCQRPGERSTTRVAEALTEIIRNPQTPIEMLEPLVTALVQVSGQMTRENAASHANQAITVLNTLWRTRTTPQERVVLAEAMSAAWKGMNSTDASDHARNVIAHLEDLPRDPKLGSLEPSRLPLALVAAYQHLDPAEKTSRVHTHLVAHANALLESLRNSKLTGIYDKATGRIVGAIVAICGHLDRTESVRVFDALLATLNDPDKERYPLASHEEVIKKAIIRMGEADIQQILGHLRAEGGLERVILEALGKTKQCSFRNKWQYLDRITPRDNATEVLPARPDK